MSADLDCFKRTVVLCAVVMLTVCYRAHNALITICIVFHSIHSPHSFLRISRFLYCFCILRIYTAHFETSAIKCTEVNYMNVVSAVFLVVFAVIGICAFVREFTIFLFRSRKNNTVMFVAPISGKCENAEYILRSAAARVKWISRGRNDCVICLDFGMDGETKRICQKICSDYGFAKLLTKQEFFEMIK